MSEWQTLSPLLRVLRPTRSSSENIQIHSPMVCSLLCVRYPYCSSLVSLFSCIQSSNTCSLFIEEARPTGDDLNLSRAGCVIRKPSNGSPRPSRPGNNIVKNHISIINSSSLRAELVCVAPQIEFHIPGWSLLRLRCARRDL